MNKSIIGGQYYNTHNTEDHTSLVALLEEVIHVDILGFVVVNSTIEEYSVNLNQYRIG